MTASTRKSDRDRGAGAEGLRQGREKELENGERATVEGGSARSGTVRDKDNERVNEERSRPSPKQRTRESP